MGAPKAAFFLHRHAVSPHLTVTKKRHNPWMPPRQPFLHKHVVSPHWTVTKKKRSPWVPPRPPFLHRHVVSPHRTVTKKATTHGCPRGRLFCTGMSLPLIGRLQQKKHNPWVPPRPPFLHRHGVSPHRTVKKKHNPWVPPKAAFFCTGMSFPPIGRL